MDDTSYHVRIPKRWLRIALIVGVTTLVVAPLTAVATHSFNDVPNDHTFHGPIEWMKESEVTRGCNPPTNTLYCPEDNVTRGQMAAFIQRFAQYIDAEDGTPARAKLADTVPNGAITGPKIANGAVGANKIANGAVGTSKIAPDAAGVALAGGYLNGFGANTIGAWFNRFGGQPTVNHVGTGDWAVTIPGLEGRLSVFAITIATAANNDCVAREFGTIDTDVVRLRAHDPDTGALTNSCDINFVIMGPNDIGVAGALGEGSSVLPEEQR